MSAEEHQYQEDLARAGKTEHGIVGEPPLSPPATASPPPSATFKKLSRSNTNPQQGRRGQFHIATTAAQRNREAATRKHDVPDTRNQSPLSSPGSQRSTQRGPTVPDANSPFMNSTFSSRQRMWNTKEGPQIPEGQKPLWK